MFNIKIQKTNLKSGFTLVELLVTISIFVILTGVILVNSNRFNGSILLDNFAYDVALSIRQAQSYGVNVQESFSGSFDLGYGVFFDLSPNTGSRTNYMLFEAPKDPSVIQYADVTASCTPDINCLQKYTIFRGASIQGICTGDQQTSACQPVTGKFVVYFVRPQLNALIVDFSDGNFDNPKPKDYADITLITTDGSTSTVEVTSVGQIYIKK